MTINEYKTALKNIIDATNDEELLRHWKTHLEWEAIQYQQREADEPQAQPEAKPISEKHPGGDTSGYSILESGLGIDE